MHPQGPLWTASKSSGHSEKGKRCRLELESKAKRVGIESVQAGTLNRCLELGVQVWEGMSVAESYARALENCENKDPS